MSEETEQERLERCKRKELEHCVKIGELERKLAIARAYRTLHEGLPWGPDGSLADSEDWELLSALEMEADCALGLREWGAGQSTIAVCWKCGRSVALGSGAYFNRCFRSPDPLCQKPEYKGSFLCAECEHQIGAEVEKRREEEANKLLPKTEIEKDFTRENGGGDSVATQMLPSCQKCAAKECCPTLSHKTPVIIGGVDYTRI
jgi:hypothetical protein